MGTDPTVDVSALLSPIGGDDPCGTLSRFDPVFDEIRRARVEESRDAIDARPVQADWRTVIAKASDTLQHRAKDLMIAAYLTEALTEAEGFAGFRDGLRVVNGLLEQYWDGVYPRIEEGDMDRRLAPLIWLTERERGSRLPNRLRDYPIVPALDDTNRLSLSFSQSTYAAPKTQTESDALYEKRRADAEERARILQEAIAAASVTSFATVREDLVECLSEITRFAQMLDGRFGANGPNTKPLREAIEDCSGFATKLFKDKGGGIEVAQAAEGVMADAQTDVPAVGLKGPIGSRDDALRRLTEVAVFFRQTEPHSPIPYLIERAVAWGGLTLEQLLQELVKDSGTRDQIGDLLGFKRG